MPVSDAIKRAVVLLTLPALLTVSAVLLILELTEADDELPARGALISEASGQAAAASAGSTVANGSASGVSESTPAEASADTDESERGDASRKGKKQAARPPLPAVDGTVTIAAVGDIVMGTEAYGFPPQGGKTFFAGVSRFLGGDVVLGNLEGTLSTGGVSKCETVAEDCFSFQTPPGYARWLRRAGFTTLNLANNHANDFGAPALRQTRATLRRHDLRHTGAPEQITVHRVGKARIAVVGFSTYDWSADMRDIEAAAELVEEATKRAHVVVVTMHAGAEGAEHQHVRPGAELFLGEDRGDPMRFARAAVDAGADLVVGHGPHVLRGMEWHRGRLIAYSLGNFGGYNTFNLDGPRQYSGILKATLNTDGTWVRGKLVATRLAGKGVPARDPAGRARALVQKLSRADFPNKAVRVDSEGTLLRSGQ